MNLTSFIPTFLLLLIIGPIVIIGWYAVTRGRTEYTANGKAFKTGKIFKGWHFFWTRQKSSYAVMLEGRPLMVEFLKLQKEFPMWGLQYSELTQSIHYPSSDAVKTDLKRYRYFIEDLTKARLALYEDDGRFRLERNVPKYVFPEWLRDPLSECVWCMASVYGSIIWWSTQWLSDYYMFWWAEHRIGAAVVFWIFYCMGCSGMNGFLKDKFKL